MDNQTTTDAPKFKLDLDNLTLGEVAAIEDLSGVAISAVEGAPQGKFLAALYMIGKRRSGAPTFTFNQALAVPISEAQSFLGLDGDDDEDETEAEIEAEGNDDSSPEIAPY